MARFIDGVLLNLIKLKTFTLHTFYKLANNILNSFSSEANSILKQIYVLFGTLALTNHNLASKQFYTYFFQTIDLMKKKIYEENALYIYGFILILRLIIEFYKTTLQRENN